MPIQQILAAIIAASAFGAAWKVQDWRYGDQIAEIRIEQAESEKEIAEKAANAQIKAIDDAVQKERAWSDAVANSLKEAREREQKQRIAADNARRTVGELRDNLSALKAGLPGLTEAAVRRYADASTGLLRDCATRYTEMADNAQRHANDVRTLTEAWPK